MVANASTRSEDHLNSDNRLKNPLIFTELEADPKTDRCKLDSAAIDRVFLLDQRTNDVELVRSNRFRDRVTELGSRTSELGPSLSQRTSMSVVLAAAAILLIFLVLVDSFETIVLPRRVTRPYRFARLFYANAWKFWRILAAQIRPPKLRETFLSVFGPLSMLILFTLWASALIFGFGFLHWSLGTIVSDPNAQGDLGLYIYMSGETFFTLGYGDLTATNPLGRSLAVAEAGMGFGFMAVIIGYLPVLFQAFSRRELIISLLDARASSPPSAGSF